MSGPRAAGTAQAGLHGGTKARETAIARRFLRTRLWPSTQELHMKIARLTRILIASIGFALLT
ncbi:MAG: hypothetical protein B7X94_04380, partial [Hydrogenophilales bacterium 17-62-8]